MLDVKATEDLWKKLINLWEDQTVLIVEHKVEHIWQHVDRVLLLNYDVCKLLLTTPQNKSWIIMKRY